MSEHISTSVETSWKNTAVYQIYPRSFHEKRVDSRDLHGEGSLEGIASKLDYLRDLGVDAIWISPFYPSPMIDGGYDVRDYCDIDERYGSLDDFDKLIVDANERDIKIVVDFIPNHTSDQHPWFQQSRTSRDNPRADWYIWRDPNPDGSPPNNWGSVFSIPQLRARQEGRLELADNELTPPVSAWKFDKTRGQYYLHSFAEQQPDLNWENPELREAMKDVMRFWIDRGVDGFRVDAVNHTAKNPDFPDEALNPNYIEGTDNPYDQHIRFHSAGYPGTFYTYLREMTSVLDEYPERDLRIIFEAYVDSDVIHEIDRISPKASSFYFGRLDNVPWKASSHKKLLDQQFEQLPPGGIANHVNGNHDKPRLVTRLGERAARTAAVINLTLPGMPFIYQGEEGGFTNVDVPPDKRDDLLGERDGARTPMLWTPEKNAGFSEVDPEKLWLPVSPRIAAENLEDQRSDPMSSFSLYRTLLHMRKAVLALREGQYVPLYTSHEDVLAYAVRRETDQAIVLANFANRPARTDIWHAQQAMGRTVLSSISLDKAPWLHLDEAITLQANESLVIVNA